MILEMKVPSPGESISEVEIAQWLVSDGDYVEKDQTIAEVDSDKATLDLPAEESGIITLKANEGDTVAVGAVVCHIDTKGKKEKNSSNNKVEKNITINQQSDLKDSDEKLEIKSSSGIASPAAKKILEEKGIDPGSVKGSGRSGRISKEDAIKALPKIDLDAISKNRKISSKKMSLLRRKVSERLVSVKNHTAMLTTFNEVNMSPIFEIRKSIKKFLKKNMM